MDTELLEAIRTIVHEAMKTELEPIRKHMGTIDTRLKKLEAVTKETNLNVKHIWKDIEILGDGIDKLKEKTRHIV